MNGGQLGHPIAHGTEFTGCSGHHQAMNQQSFGRMITVVAPVKASAGAVVLKTVLAVGDSLER
jgi:hypothetical protein